MSFVNKIARVNILGEALDGLGRWYVAVPPFLIIGFLAVLFYFIGAGQSRLQEAGDRLQKSAAREHVLDGLQSSLSRSVSAQRSYLLTGDQKYVEIYKVTAADVEPRLERLQTAYAGLESSVADVRALHILVGKRLADLTMVLAIQKTQGTPSAIALVKTRVGSDAGHAIGDILDRMRGREAFEHDAATAHWAGSQRLSRWLTLGGMIFNMLLIGIAARLVYMDLHRRTLQTGQLRDQKLRLEREAEDRTRELAELSSHLQNASEHEKAGLARELHDELGGLLVGARMDISWVEQHLAESDPAMKLRLNRAQQNLATSIDMKRRIIEELRPTLLDNVGLFAALRWQLKVTCGAAGLKCTEAYPDEEPKLTAEASIGLFRIAQEAFSNILEHSAAKTVDVELQLDAGAVVMRISDDGIGIPTHRLNAVGSHGLASMRHRARALGGQLDVTSPSSGGTSLVVRVPAAGVRHVG